MLQALRTGRRDAFAIDASPGTDAANDGTLAPVFFPGASSAGPVGSFNLEYGQETRVDLVVPESWAGSVSGSIAGLEAGEQARVTLEPRVAFDVGLADVRTLTAWTAADGKFTFRALSPGTYIVTVRVDGNARSGAKGRWGQSVVEVAHGGAAHITIPVQAGLTVSGRIAIAGDSSSPATLPPLSVRLVGVGGGAFPVMRAVPDADGRFEFSDVPPARYRVSVSAIGAPNGWVAESAECAGVDALDVPCDLSRTEGGALVVTMTDKRAGIWGRLDSAEGLVPESLLVLAFPMAEHEWNRDSRRIRLARLAADGEFSFELPPGRYYLGVMASTVVAEAVSPDTLNRLKAVAVSVVVTRGERVRQDIRIGR